MIIPKSAFEEEIASEAVVDAVNAGIKTAGKVIDSAATVGKAALLVKGTIGKSSITRMGKDSIMQFPTVLSSSIETDDAIAIAKMLERQYATLLVSIFSLRPAVSLNEFNDIAEYIKSIHNNEGIPTNLKKAQHMAKESYADDDFCLVDDEPSGLCIEASTFDYGPDGDKLAYECWGVYGGCVDTDNLNELVQPYQRSAKLLQDRIEYAKTSKATEALADTIGSSADQLKTKGMKVVNVSKNTSNALGANSDFSSTKSINTGGNIFTENKLLISMAPTMINATFYLHGSKSGDAGNAANFTQNVVLGVKSMARSVSSDYMVTNLVEGSKSSNPIFKLIAWTRGEYKLVKDLIFNVTEVKKKFKNKAKEETMLLDMSKNRKEVDNVTKFAGNRVLPYLSLVATEYEVAQAAQITGVDLSEYRNAKAFMERYYLLAFAIYNTSTKSLSVLFDGAADFEVMSMTYMQSTQKKDLDIVKSLGNLASIR